MTMTFKVVRLLGGLGLAGMLALASGQVLGAQRQDPQDPQEVARAQAKEKLLSTRACVECDLAGVSFWKGADLRGVDLARASMAGAGLYGADLSNANLAGADLSKAVLSFADLKNTNLAGANLEGAVLSGAKDASLATAKTNDTTVCPDGQAGPCR